MNNALSLAISATTMLFLVVCPTALLGAPEIMVLGGGVDPNETPVNPGGGTCYFVGDSCVTEQPSSCPYSEATNCTCNGGRASFGGCTTTLTSHPLRSGGATDDGCAGSETTTNSPGNSGLCPACTPPGPIAPDGGDGFCLLPPGVGIDACAAGQIWTNSPDGAVTPCSFIRPDPITGEPRCSAYQVDDQGLISNYSPSRCCLDEDGDGVGAGCGMNDPDPTGGGFGGHGQNDCDDADGRIQAGCNISVSTELRFHPLYLADLASWGVDTERLRSRSVQIGRPERCRLDPDDYQSDLSAIDWNGDGVPPSEDRNCGPVANGVVPRDTYPLPGKIAAFEGSYVQCLTLVSMDPRLGMGSQRVSIKLQERSRPGDDWVTLLGDGASMSLSDCSDRYDFFDSTGPEPRTVTFWADGRYYDDNSNPPENRVACIQNYYVGAASRGKELRCLAYGFSGREPQPRSGETMREFERSLRRHGFSTSETMFVAGNTTFVAPVKTELVIDPRLIRIHEQCAEVLPEFSLPPRGSAPSEPIRIQIPAPQLNELMPAAVDKFEEISETTATPGWYRLHLYLSNAIDQINRIPWYFGIQSRSATPSMITTSCSYAPGTPPTYNISQLHDLVTSEDLNANYFTFATQNLLRGWIDYIGNFAPYSPNGDTADRLVLVPKVNNLYQYLPSFVFNSIAGSYEQPNTFNLTFENTYAEARYSDTGVTLTGPPYDNSIFLVDALSTVLSHEYGHSLHELCDEYSATLWTNQNRNRRGGCKNSFPQFCANPNQRAQERGIGPERCPGMLLRTLNEPDPLYQSSIHAAVSIMGPCDANQVIFGGTAVSYPVTTRHTPTCELRDYPYGECQNENR